MDAIWASVISVVGVVLLSPLGLFLAGRLVPVSRVTDAEKTAATWKESYDTLKTAFDKQTELLTRQQQTAEITDKVMSAVNQRIDRLETNRGVVP